MWRMVEVRGKRVPVSMKGCRVWVQLKVHGLACSSGVGVCGARGMCHTVELRGRKVLVAANPLNESI